MGYSTTIQVQASATATMTISTGTYLAGTVYGQAAVIPGAINNGGGGTITTLRLTGLTTTYPFNVWFFSAPTAAASTNGSTFTLAAADYSTFLGAVNISGTDYYTPGSGRPCAYVGSGLFYQTASTTNAIYAYMIPTIVTTGGAAVPTLSVTVEHIS